ncbi:MAG: ribosome small subunit-dependent GTPase A [Acidobacteriota bacterium]|nr:ribosome small subunit-dependent GTPase A [Acidobacteriota bacterium]
MTFDLKDLGWDDEWARVFAPHAADGLLPARVAIEFNHIFRLYAEAGELQAQHSGRLLHRAEGKQELSAVGDWVAVLPTPGEAMATIEAVLPRRSRFSRKVAGELTEEQIVAANIDTVFLVMGLDGDYNPRRLERYLVMAFESGASPVVLLNKSDVAADHLAAHLDEISTLAVGIPVHAVSARTGQGLDVFERYMGPGRTAALLGSSGVGKSTLVNSLVGEELLKTKDVRAHDSRGRHTTRHRHLILLPGRGLLIDTPGMRELQLWSQEGAIETFDDVEALAAGCHFTDCRHKEEPRCAVKQAIADGTLAPGRLEGYLKLQDEIQSFGARKNVRAQIDEKRKMKTINQSLKKLYKSRDR